MYASIEPNCLAFLARSRLILISPLSARPFLLGYCSTPASVISASAQRKARALAKIALSPFDMDRHDASRPCSINGTPLLPSLSLSEVRRNSSHIKSAAFKFSRAHTRATAMKSHFFLVTQFKRIIYDSMRAAAARATPEKFFGSLKYCGSTCNNGLMFSSAFLSAHPPRYQSPLKIA